MHRIEFLDLMRSKKIKSGHSFLLQKRCYFIDQLKSTASTDNYGAKAKRGLYNINALLSFQRVDM